MVSCIFYILFLISRMQMCVNKELIRKNIAISFLTLHSLAPILDENFSQKEYVTEVRSLLKIQLSNAQLELLLYGLYLRETDWSLFLFRISTANFSISLKWCVGISFISFSHFFVFFQSCFFCNFLIVDGLSKILMEFSFAAF